MEDGAARPPDRRRLPLIRDERDILPLALAVCASNGDPTPQLVQHATGTREAATRTTGSVVFSDEPSYLIAIRGSFESPGPSRPFSPRELTRERLGEGCVSWSVQVIVVCIRTGEITDSGGSHEYPDLASVGPIITDYPVSP
jgi:hypothetical protein